MNQTIMIKGKLIGLHLKKKTKSRQANSSIGFFELNGKTIVPYNLKHYLRTINMIAIQHNQKKYMLDMTTKKLNANLPSQPTAVSGPHSLGAEECSELKVSHEILSPRCGKGIKGTSASIAPTERQVFEFPWLESSTSSPSSVQGTLATAKKNTFNNLVISPHEVKKDIFEKNT